MAQFDLIVRNGHVLSTALDTPADVAISDGKIVEVGDIAGDASQTLDATGLIVTPGGVDVHCHIEQMSGMGVMNADTFETATRSALLGGTTTTVSFAPQTDAGIVASVQNYAGLADAGAMTDHAFHIIIIDLSERGALDDLRNAIAAGHRSIKVFTTYNIQLSDRDICDVLAVAREAGALVCIHAENDGLIGWTKSQLLAAGKTEPRYHAVSHPRLAEIEAVERLIRFAEFFATPVMLFHISTREAVDAIRRAKARGVPVWAETCPHYLLMDATVLEKPGLEAAKWMCSPPQRQKEDQSALWDGLADGTLSIISSDHAPYRFDASGKLLAGEDADFSQIANGLPGLEVRMPLMFDAMVSSGDHARQAFVRLCCAEPAKLHGLPAKGDIATGFDADLVLWDSEKSKTYRENDLSDNVGYNPWSGRTVRGWPEIVLRRGELVVRDGEMLSQPGDGKWIDRPKMGVETDAQPASEYVEAMTEQ